MSHTKFLLLLTTYGPTNDEDSRCPHVDKPMMDHRPMMECLLGCRDGGDTRAHIVHRFPSESEDAASVAGGSTGTAVRPWFPWPLAVYRE